MPDQPSYPALPPDAAPGAALYAALAAPFPATFHRQGGGGADLEYVTGEQVVSRLNTVLGPLAWSFVVRDHGIHAEADEIWVQGELTVQVGGVLDCHGGAGPPTVVQPPQTIARAQFGSQKIKRARQTGTPLDIGFDQKGATTDALKKCASLFGVGLYLLEKEPPPADARDPHGPLPEMWQLVGGGYARPADDRWAPFWNAVQEQLHLSGPEVCGLIGDVSDPDLYLQRLQTTIEHLFRLLKYHVESPGNPPLPQALPAGRHAPAGR